MSGSVSTMRAARLSYGIVLRQLVTRGRIAALLLVGAAATAIAIAVGSSDTNTDSLETGVELISSLHFTLLVPIISLVFASAALGDMREDGTLVYLWLRPMDRWPIVVGAWLASITLSLPLTLIPLIVSSIAVGGGGDLLGATMLAGVVGVVAYSALFVLLGLLLKNSIVWGLGYIMIWEGLIAAFGSFAAKLAVRGYTRSILTSITEIDLDLGDLSLPVGVIVPLIVAVVALALASVRLRSMDVA